MVRRFLYVCVCVCVCVTVATMGGGDWGSCACLQACISVVRTRACMCLARTPATRTHTISSLLCMHTRHLKPLNQSESAASFYVVSDQVNTRSTRHTPHRHTHAHKYRHTQIHAHLYMHTQIYTARQPHSQTPLSTAVVPI